jgi:hypothetical protein
MNGDRETKISDMIKTYLNGNKNDAREDLKNVDSVEIIETAMVFFGYDLNEAFKVAKGIKNPS